MTTSSIPADFPHSVPLGSVTGVQPKLLVSETPGGYIIPGSSEADRAEAYAMCEDLAHQLVSYCQRKLDSAAVPTKRAALERSLTGLRQRDWCTEPQAQWVIRRTALLLGWSDEWSA